MHNNKISIFIGVTAQTNALVSTQTNVLHSNKPSNVHAMQQNDVFWSFCGPCPLH